MNKWDRLPRITEDEFVAHLDDNHFFEEYLVELKRALDDAVGLKGMEIMTISRPEAYIEYAPYQIIEDEQEFIRLVKAMRDASAAQRNTGRKGKSVKRWTEYLQDGMRKRSLEIDMRLQSFFGTTGNTTTKRFPKLLG